MFWSGEEVKGTGWREGWYMAVVKDGIDLNIGTATVVYIVEPTSAVAWGGAGGARAPPIIWQTQKKIY